MDSKTRFSIECSLSWCCHSVCTEATINPFSLIIARYGQLVFHSTVNTDKYRRAAHPPATTHSILLMSHLELRACAAQIQQIDMNQLSFIRLWRYWKYERSAPAWLFPSKWSQHFSRMFSCRSQHSAHTLASVEKSV